MRYPHGRKKVIVCRLLDVLEARGLSRRGLARATGVSTNTICKWAHGDLQLADLRVLAEICEALECQPGALFEWIPNTVPLTE